MGKNRDLNPLDPLPANQVDALNEFIGGLVSGNFELRIRAADPTVLEIPAGPGNDQVSIGIGTPADAAKMRWRYISATVSRVGLAGAARSLDVFVTATDNSFAPGSPGEVDTTNYGFSLVVTETAVAPAGPPALYRKIGVAQWDGAKFSSVSPAVGKGTAANTTSVVKQIGDGTTGPFHFDHGIGTRDVIVEVYASSSPWDTVDVRVERPSVDRVSVFPDVPIAAGGAFVVVSSRGTTTGAVASHGYSHRTGQPDPTAFIGALNPVRTVGELGQIAAGRALTAADFAALGLNPPLGLWNDGVTDVSGNGRDLTNKGAVPFGPGINGAAAEAAVFAGATAQALYRADTGAADPFRIRTGAWFGWFRCAKRGSVEWIISKFTGAAGQNVFGLTLQGANTLSASVSSDGSATQTIAGTSDVVDDRWHFGFVTHDGTKLRLYVDAALEAQVAATGLLFAGSAPLNIGGRAADGATATVNPSFCRVQVAGVLSDVPSEEQIRALMARSIPHGLVAAPALPSMRATRRRRGALVARADVTGMGVGEPARIYNLDDLADDSVNAVALAANPGTGAIVQVAGPDGVAGTARSYSGAHTGDSATDAGLPAGLAARSYGGWFKSSAAPAVSEGLVGWGTAATETALRLAISGGSGPFAVQSISATDIIYGPVSNDGLWHFMWVVEDNAAVDAKRKLYVDARLVAASTVLNAVTLGGANFFRIGATSIGGGPLIGQAGRVLVLPYAITPEQVRALYALSRPMVPASPKDAADNIEYMDALNLYVVHNDLEPQDQVELVAA